MKLTTKQTLCLHYLEDGETIEAYYGGAAGGGKSALGCFWQLKRRLLYPATKGLIGRAIGKTLKETTLQTFHDIAKAQGVKRNIHYVLTTAQDKDYPNCIVFKNDSVIYLKDLFSYPADPDFDELGSLEITDAFIDEAPQVTEKAKNIVRSRIRYKLDEFGLKPKLLMTGNPSKNWAYQKFYRPWKDGNLRQDFKFIQALPGDNPHLPESYIESLRGLDKNSRERLLYGNWEYDDDPSSLINYDAITAMFDNPIAQEGEKYLTADIARYGSDKTVFAVWNGWRCKIYVFAKLGVDEVANKIKDFCNMYEIPIFNVLADEDGVGGGVVDLLKCKGFVNNSRPQDGNYDNLKSECYYKLAEAINKGKICVQDATLQVRELLSEELEQVKQYQMDKDGKRRVLPKDKVKEAIGRSPDISDALMMRMWFANRPKTLLISI